MVVNVSDALIWECVKRNSSFIVSKNGRTRRVGNIQFAAEPFNLTQRNSFKYSGLANSKAIDVSIRSSKGDKYGPKIFMATKSKNNLSRPSKVANRTILNKAADASAKSIKGLAGRGYRPDLQQEALGRFRALKSYHQVQQKLRKSKPMKRGRSKKTT